MRLEGEVPTEADLEHARQRRDVGWELALQAWRDGSPGGDPAAVAAFVDEFAAGGDLATAFRASIDRADVVADRFRREANRVAIKAKLTADLQNSESNLEKAREAWQEAKGNLERIRSEWRSQWEPAGVEPLSPREMRPWRTQQRSLAQTAADIRKRTANIERLVKQINSLSADLNDCLDALDQTRVPDEEPLSTALDRCQEIAEQIHQDNQQQEQLERAPPIAGRRTRAGRANRRH